MTMLHFWSLLLVLLPVAVNGVNRNDFKTCDQSGFCKRQQAVQEGQSPYQVLLPTAKVEDGKMSVQVLNTVSQVYLGLELYALEDSTARLKINEIEPLRTRYEPPIGDVLVSDPKQASMSVETQTDDGLTLQFDNYKLVIQASPFRLDFMIDGVPVISVNARGLMMFEHYRQRDREEPPPAEEEQAREEQDREDEKEAQKPEEEEPNMWEETFKSHHDSKPYGPSSVGLDISFPGFEFVYGIPEHADTLALKSTKNGDPYRLYNLDVFEYETYNPMALYGSIPVMLAHNEERTIGVFWLNAAETWVDINSNIADKNMFSKLVDLLKQDSDIPQVDTKWISESGIIDVFFMLGPRPSDVFKQYARLTGTTPLPPLFSLAYHQSRWNYNDEQDVASVSAGFDEHDIPLDVIWLDIEHTDGKRYFTWDKHKFPNPEKMINDVASVGRKMVTIVDPHIKQDENYHIYKEMRDMNIYVKNKDGNDYDGWCWPGASRWPDFIDPEIRKFWANKFLLSSYEGSTLDLYTWNDMNEPSVFNAPEITMHKDAKHYGDLEHRDIHNIYGMYLHMSTVEGHKLRSEGKKRPFVLSRAFFAGTQRYGAVWTGDNTADWVHLKISLPMIMSLNLVGVTFSGADVGGFFKNPDPELLTRWYQAGAYQPFFRAHAHLDTRRREPWLLPKENMLIIRKAINARYSLLPYWYTLFYHSEQNGAAVMRPMWVDFPSDKATFAIEDEYMIGSGLLVRPVLDSGASSVSAYLPGVDELWYDVDTYQVYTGGRTVYIPVTLEKVPVLQRGGHIIPRKLRMRRASSLTYHDPYTLVVALDKKATAHGDLYFDDFDTFQYKQGKFIHRNFTFKDSVLTSTNLNIAEEGFRSFAWLERVIIAGIAQEPSSISISAKDSQLNLDFTYNPQNKLLTIRKPGVNINADFTITIMQKA